MDIYLNTFKKYVEFNGRAGRREFWTFTLINWVISMALSFLGEAADDSFNILSGLFSLAILLPSLGVSVRRLHDIGKSGWNILWFLLPIIGWIVLLVYYVRPSMEGKNKYDSGFVPSEKTEEKKEEVKEVVEEKKEEVV